MNKPLVIVLCCAALASVAFAQGTPAAKPAAPAAAHPAAKPAAKPGEHMAKPGEHMGKPGEHMEHMAKPGEHMGKPGEHMEHAAKPGGKPAAAPGKPTPPPELDAAMKFFNGTWKCDTKMAAGSMGPGSPELTGKSTVRFKKVQHGFYYQGEYALRKTKTTPGFKGTFLISYQPGAKLFVMTGSDETGGASYEISPGMQSDTITFLGEGYMMGHKMKIRESMSKKGEKEAGHKMEVDMGKGFQVMGEDDCKR